LQATTGVVRSIPIVIPLPDDADHLPVVNAVGGGSIGVTFVHPSRRMIGVRFDLQASVKTPETAMVEFEVAYPALVPIRPGDRLWDEASRSGDQHLGAVRSRSDTGLDLRVRGERRWF
jgi:hypothetical protein